MMRVHLNTPPPSSRLADWAIEIRLDTTCTRPLTPSQKTRVSRWIRDKLVLCEADFRWRPGSWETIASKTVPRASAKEGGGDTIHVVVVQEQLDQNDHEFRIAVAVQTTRVGDGRWRRMEDVLVLVDVGLDRRVSWLMAG